MPTNIKIILCAAFYVISLLYIHIAYADDEIATSTENSSNLVLNHAITGSVITPTHTESTPTGVGIPHSLINTLSAGEYYAVVFFEGLGGCPTPFYYINSYIPEQIWAEDIRGPSGMYSHAYASSGGGCMQKFFVNPDRGEDWLWGALDPNNSAPQIADINGIPAFAICATEEACDPIQPHADLSASSTNTGESLAGIPTNVMSSVLFLPGIKTSSLFERSPLCIPFTQVCDIPLWLPLSDSVIPHLYLNDEGKSLDNIYTKEDAVISHVLNAHFYDSLESQLNSYVVATTSERAWSWKAIAYDWRLSLPDIVNGGTTDGERLTYGTTSDLPYIERELRRLASTSPSGKVTIIAHSNGGLVAKAVLQKIGTEETQRLIDSVVLVGVPQAGSPQALASLLYGDGESLPGFNLLPNILLSTHHARSFALHAPMTYHLLPTASYVDSLSKPLIRFGGGSLLENERNAYGNEISNFINLQAYLRNAEGRSFPAENDTSSPATLSTTLLEYAIREHQQIDKWTPPSGVTVYEIAGTGIDTLSGITQYEQKSRSLFGMQYHIAYGPLFEQDGDGTVPRTSGLMLPTSASTKKITVDLAAASSADAHYDHATLLEVPKVLSILNDILTTKSIADTSTHDVPASNETGSKKLLLTVHASIPIALTASDTQRVVANVEENGSIVSTKDIRSGTIGDDSYILMPLSHYDISLTSKASSTADIDFTEIEHGVEVATSTISGIPLNEHTQTRIMYNGAITTSTVVITESQTIHGIASSTERTVQPVVGETVFVPEEIAEAIIETLPTNVPPSTNSPAPIEQTIQTSTIHSSIPAQVAKTVLHTKVVTHTKALLKRGVPLRIQKLKKHKIIAKTRKPKKLQTRPVRIPKIQLIKRLKGPAKK